MLLIDTHVLIWLDEGSPRLGAEALRRIDRAFADNELVVSAISFWETAMLVQKGRLSIDGELSVWREELLTSGLNEIPISGELAIAAGALENFHGDPADRLIAATALLKDALLLTADKKILGWPMVKAVDAKR